MERGTKKDFFLAFFLQGGLVGHDEQINYLLKVRSLWEKFPRTSHVLNQYPSPLNLKSLRSSTYYNGQGI